MEVVKNDEEDEEEEEEQMQREVREFENKRENYMTQNENGWVCVVVVAVAYIWVGVDIFASLCVIVC